MSGVGLCKITGDPEATARTRRALARLGTPELVVTSDGIFVNNDGQLAVRPGQDATPYRAITAATTITSTDFTIHATAGGPFTQPLPTSVGIGGRIYAAKNNSGGTITLDPAGAETIDGAATLAVANGSAVTIQSTGAGWITI